MTRTDSFSATDHLFSAVLPVSPWQHQGASQPYYKPDYRLLEAALQVAVQSGKGASSGALASALDAWIASELRRAGFANDEVWPRATRPRVMSREVALLLRQLPTRLSQEVRARIEASPSIGPSDARVLGRAYEKQVDVVIARWERGPELLLSTKTQTSSFGKNLSNRFEEAYGDAGNLRGRYPLAATGFFLLQRRTILTSEPEAFERSVDMMRKLRDRGVGDGYTATALLLFDADASGTRVDVESVPADLQPSQFMKAIVGHILAMTPVTQHTAVRELYENRVLRVEEDGER